MGACCFAGWLRNGFSDTASGRPAPASQHFRSSLSLSVTRLLALLHHPPKILPLPVILSAFFSQAVDDFLSKEVKYVVTDRHEWFVERRSGSFFGQWSSSVASPAVPEETKKKTQVGLRCFANFDGSLIFVLSAEIAGGCHA
jgi:hypothetical protein